jgi:hypothetical protein
LQNSPVENTRTSSTTFAWRYTKIRRPPEAHRDSAAGGGSGGGSKTRWRRFGHREPRKPIQVVLRLRGGPEAWVEVRARGEVNYYPGYTQLIDVLLDINQAH